MTTDQSTSPKGAAMGFVQKYITNPIREAVGDEIRRHIPVLVKAVVVAVSETLREAAVSRIDEITDKIPGELDDQILDGVAKRAAEILKRFGL